MLGVQLYCTMSQQQKQFIEQEPEVMIDEEVVMNRESVIDTVKGVSEEITVKDFTAPVSGINHGHDTSKHDVRQSFGVRDEFVSEFFTDFGIAPNDHAALWLMSYRKEEAINHDEKVFKDTEDTDSQRWSRIDDAKTAAPIPPQTQEMLKP